MSHYRSGKVLPNKNKISFSSSKRCAVCGKPIEDNLKYKLCEECRKLKLTVPPKRKSYPCNTRKICKNCQFRVLFDTKNYICDCLEQTGNIRDLEATDTECKTFKAKDGEKNG